MNDTVQSKVKNGKDKEYQFWILRRRLLIMELGAIEDYLEMKRSIIPNRKKVKQERVEDKVV